jgi:hypothetical protein
MGANENSDPISQAGAEKMNYESNIRCHPEKWGLEVVASYDTGGAYDFDEYIIFKDKEGNHYYAYDSGCSCPTPFEDFNSMADLTPITDFGVFKSTIKAWNSASLDEKLGLIAKVKESLDKVKK